MSGHETVLSESVNNIKINSLQPCDAPNSGSYWLTF